MRLTPSTVRVRIEGEGDVELRAHRAELERVVGHAGLLADLLHAHVADAAEEPGGHRPAGRLDHLRTGGRGQVRAEFGNAPVADEDVGVLEHPGGGWPCARWHRG